MHCHKVIIDSCSNQKPLIIMISYYMIDCDLSSVSHQFRDTAPPSRKPPHHNLSPLEGTPLNFVVKFIKRKAGILASYQWKPHDPSFRRFVTNHRRQKTSWQQPTFHCNLQRVAFKKMENLKLHIHYSKRQKTTILPQECWSSINSQTASVLHELT